MNKQLSGIVRASDLSEELRELYENGLPRGRSTGWLSLDRHYTVKPGELTVVTGVPGSGKSNFVDAMMVNMARRDDWRFAIFSPENHPVQQHIAALMEKYLRKPFHEGPTARITPEEFEQTKRWIDLHFDFFLPGEGEVRSLGTIVALASQAHARDGINGLVIDPWNELEHLRPPSMTETEYIGRSLSSIRAFARERACHAWVVVHPTKLQRENGKYPVPSLWDCHGSANWRNKADNGIVVWRDLSEKDTPEVQIHIQKIRFRSTGMRGVVTLLYDKICATYEEES